MVDQLIMTRETNYESIYINKWMFLNIFFLLILPVNNYSQELNVGPVQHADSLQLADSLQFIDPVLTIDENFSFFMLDFSFTNNKTNTKSQTTESVPALFSDISFLHKSGLYTDLMSTNFTGIDSLSYDIDIMFGYQNSYFKDLLDIDLNYRYHKYTGTSDFESIEYNHAFYLSSGITCNMIYLYADGDFYLDNENYFTDFGLSLLIDFDDVLFKNDFILLQPSLSLTYGSDYWLYDINKTYAENFLIPVIIDPYFRKRGQSINNLSSDEIIQRYFEYQRISTNTYSYQNLDFLIPITYGINGISFSFTWMYYNPSRKLKVFRMGEQSGYIISLSFIF